MKLGGVGLLGLLGLLGLVASAGCVDLIPSPEIRHDIKDVKRKSDAAKWAGTYTFSECATVLGADGAPPACWRYVIVVDTSADAVMTVEGPQPTPQVKATARVYKAGKLDFRFSSYADEGLDVSDLGIRAFEPLRGRYTPGQPLAVLARDASGRHCLTFDGMDSKLGTKVLCAGP